MFDKSNRPKVGVGVLLIKGRQLLLGLRHGSHGSGTWHPPGGHIEYGEAVEQTAIREVAEETGITIHQLQQGSWTNDVFVEEKKHYITVYMISRNFSGEAKVLEPDKCSQWQWFDYQDLPSPLFLPLRNLIETGEFSRIFEHD